jgi:hypothetical protein
VKRLASEGVIRLGRLFFFGIFCFLFFASTRHSAATLVNINTSMLTAFCITSLYIYLYLGDRTSEPDMQVLAATSTHTGSLRRATAGVDWRHTFCRRSGSIP